MNTKDATSDASGRDDLSALDREMRRLGSETVMFNHAIAERLGIHPTDWECLDILNWTGPIPAGRLAELTGLTTGAITGVIDRLEEARLVRRERDPDDRRRVIIQPRYEELGSKVEPLFASFAQEMTELVSSYSDEERALFLDLFRHVNQIFQQETVRLRSEAKDRE